MRYRAEALARGRRSGSASGRRAARKASFSATRVAGRSRVLSSTMSRDAAVLPAPRAPTTTDASPAPIRVIASVRNT